MQTLILLPILQKLMNDRCFMLRKLIIITLFSSLFFHCSHAQSNQVEIDSVQYQQRIDAEIEAFNKWKDSVEQARGRSSYNENDNAVVNPGAGLPTADQLVESEKRLSQLKKIIIWLFVLVMVLGVFLSKPWKKREKSAS